MKILQTLWGELKGVFGKSYLLAGALPAALLVLGWTWFHTRRSLTSLIGDALDVLTAEEPAEDVLAILLFALSLGLAFFAARGPLVDLLQRLPGRALAPLRRELVRRQHARWLRIEREADDLIHLLTILDKLLVRGGLEAPTSLPPTERVPGRSVMRAASGKARKTLSTLLRAGLPPTVPPSRGDTDTILDGLRALYAHAHVNPNSRAVAAEVSAWRSLSEKPPIRRILEIVADGVWREWGEARLKLDGLPEPRWLRPTALGTRASGLDDYAEKRYGVPTSTLVHRLLGTLPEAERKEIGNARLQVETLVNLAASMTLLTVAVIVGAVTAGFRHAYAGGDLVRDPRTAAFIAVPTLLACLFYRASVIAYGELAEKLVRTVDLHRLNLIESLGFERPRDVGEERELWKELSRFFAGDAELDPDRPIVPKKQE